MPPENETSFGIYIHWPFCAAKCPYCDFNSHVRHRTIDQSRYARAFDSELQYFTELAAGRLVTSIFIGGGTPSLMAADTVSEILEGIAKYWPISDSAEITLEANPSSVEADRFRGYRAAGINRLSLGVQSLNDADLKYLGRLHDAEEALRAAEIAREIFPRMSLDFIYGRPGQDLADWTDELNKALDLAADHISLYQLTIEPDTPFASLRDAGKLVMPGAGVLADFYEHTRRICAERGFSAYEISNFARPGGESRHNLTYWRYKDYVGCGPGAHGRLTEPAGRRATINEAAPERWLELVEQQGHGVIDDVYLSSEEAGDELLLMGMRLGEGISPDRYAEVSGRALNPARLASLLNHGMIEMAQPDRLRATAQGFAVLDAVVADLAA